MKLSPFVSELCVSPLPVPASWYAVPLRLIVGLGFFEHGYAKLARGADGFIAILLAIGMPFAHVLGWATIAVELAGGLSILLGAFVPVATLPMIVVLMVAVLPFIFPTDSAPSSSCHTVRPERISANPATRPICCTLQVSSPSASAAPARSP